MGSRHQYGRYGYPLLGVVLPFGSKMDSGRGDDDTSWILELESALLTECDLNSIRKICKGKPVPDNLRADFWQVCLGVKGKDATETWDEIYDLPQQPEIRKDCQNLVDRLGNEEDDKVSVVSDLESVLTRYCKSTGSQYQKDNGWLETLEPLLALKLQREQLYNCFCAIQSIFIPRRCHKNGQPFHLFRLLLLYHDPELCSFLDTKKITPDAYAATWFRSLFSVSCDLKVIEIMWDLYFQMADPYLIFFLSLGILINLRDQLLAMKDDNCLNIIDMLANAPCALEANDVEDFCLVAQYYASRTPQSFSKEYHSLIFGDNEPTTDIDLSQALCLPVAVHELVLNNRLELDKSSGVNYFVVDCRPAEQYNSGHLSTAFHLDANLMLQEPTAFNTAVEALFAAQQQAISAGSVAGGEHLCFMGSGRDDEDQYVHMVVASFLQKHLHFVSLALGGYAALHEFLSEDSSSSLVDHNSKACIVCSPSQHMQMFVDGDDEEVSFLNKLTSAVRSRTVGVREKLVEYIRNPQQPVERHVSSTDKVGKRYRVKESVFSIDDSSDSATQEFSCFTSLDEEGEEISLHSWLKKPEVMGHFKCSEVKDTGHMYPSLLLVTKTHLYVLRNIPHNKGYVRVIAKRRLESIVKITSKRRHPELITFKYGSLGELDEVNVTAVDKLLIPQAGDATHLIKYQVIKILNGSGADVSS